MLDDAGTPGLEEYAEAVRRTVAAAHAGLVDRALVAETVVLCAVAGEHLLVIGAPGTAKSEAVRRVARGLGSNCFEYLLGRFTEPNEIFGPVDLRRLREGVVEIETTGMLPEAEVAFLDEVFLGSTAILNTLLTLLNERTFRRGSTALACPLRVCVGAANALPDEPGLAAFADRFLARVFLEPVEDARLEELLEYGWSAGSPSAAARPQGPGSPAAHPTGDPGTGRTATLAAVDRLAAAARGCDLGTVRPLLARAVRRLRSTGVPLSDRRVVRTQRLVAAAAVLDGRTRATDADLWVLPLVAPSADAQAATQEALADLLGAARNGSLGHSAAQLSRGPAARAERLRQIGGDLLVELDRRPPGADDRLRVEATLREIDASVAPTELSSGLAEVRARLLATLRS